MNAEAYTEKVSVNINTATLSNIDLLVDAGYYSNRSDFINQAVRAELQRQSAATEQIVRRKERGNEHNWFLGVYGITARDVEDMYARGETTDLVGYGLLIIHEGCDEEKLFSVVRSISVRGRVRASATVRAHYGL